jgi:hypothetical protein
LGEVKSTGHGARLFTLQAHWPPILLQGLPHRSPVLRGRFHHDLFDLAFDEPVGERAQLGGIGPHLQTLEAAKADASVQRN